MSSAGYWDARYGQSEGFGARGRGMVRYNANRGYRTLRKLYADEKDPGKTYGSGNDREDLAEWTYKKTDDPAMKALYKLYEDIDLNPQNYSLDTKDWTEAFKKARAEAEAAGSRYDDTWWKNAQDDSWWKVRDAATQENVSTTVMGVGGWDPQTLEEGFWERARNRGIEQQTQQARDLAEQVRIEQEQEQERKDQQTRPEDLVRRRVNEGLGTRNPDNPVVGTVTVAARGPTGTYPNSRNTAPVRPASSPGPVVSAR